MVLVPHNAVWCRAVLFGREPACIAWYGVVKLSMVQCSVAWYCMVLGTLLAGAGSINSLV